MHRLGLIELSLLRIVHVLILWFSLFKSCLISHCLHHLLSLLCQDYRTTTSCPIHHDLWYILTLVIMDPMLDMVELFVSGTPSPAQLHNRWVIDLGDGKASHQARRKSLVSIWEFGRPFQIVTICLSATPATLLSVLRPFLWLLLISSTHLYCFINDQNWSAFVFEWRYAWKLVLDRSEGAYIFTYDGFRMQGRYGYQRMTGRTSNGNWFEPSVLRTGLVTISDRLIISSAGTANSNSKARTSVNSMAFILEVSSMY